MGVGRTPDTRLKDENWSTVIWEAAQISIETETSLFRQKIKHENYSHCAQ